MKTKLAAIAALLFSAMPLCAHRIDEYLQATLVSLEPDELRGSLRLVPGVAVSQTVIAAADLDADGVFSPAEQQTYARQVLADLSIALDSQILQPRLLRVHFPPPSEMKEGLGRIDIEFAAALPPAPGFRQRTLVMQNRHRPAISVYLMNCLVPQHAGLRVIAQTRNANQSSYRVDFTQSGAAEASPSFWRPRFAAALSSFAEVPVTFRLGMRHIAAGADHLLFLLALLLPAPLVACGARWVPSPAVVRCAFTRIVRIVTAFTLGHSLTLVLGAMGILSLPQRAVEVFIAISVLISAAHALRPLFPGREPLVAALFGLVHGLAFASALQNLAAGLWQRLAGIFGFNLGIEVMQLLVVSAVLPSLLILSRTPAYPWFRRAGALLAGAAAVGWIIERLFTQNDSVDPFFAFALFALSLICWAFANPRLKVVNL